MAKELFGSPSWKKAKDLERKSEMKEIGKAKKSHIKEEKKELKKIGIKRKSV